MMFYFILFYFSLPLFVAFVATSNSITSLTKQWKSHSHFNGRIRASKGRVGDASNPLSQSTSHPQTRTQFLHLSTSILSFSITHPFPKQHLPRLFSRYTRFIFFFFFFFFFLLLCFLRMLFFILCYAESTSLEQTKRIQLALPDGEKKVVMEKGKTSELQSPNTRKRKDRVDLVLEKAQICLKKIRLFKTSLLSSTC